MRPTFIRPLVPADAARPPRGPGWLFEPKIDGFRFQILKDGDQVRLFSKSGAEYTDRLPRMVEWFRRLPSTSAVLDGELIYAGTDGRPPFYKLLYEMRTRWRDEDRMIYLVFDLLHEDGGDLRPLPLTTRKRQLDRLCRRSKISIMKQVLTFPDGTILIEHCARLGFEGVVAKKSRPAIRQRPVEGLGENKMPGLEARQPGKISPVRGTHTLMWLYSALRTRQYADLSPPRLPWPRRRRVAAKSCRLRVEAILPQHPGVRDATVGFKDDDLGRRVHAWIEPANAGAPPALEELDAHLRLHLASYKLPRSYEIVTTLPRDAAGKIRRSKLRDERGG